MDESSGTVSPPVGKLLFGKYEVGKLLGCGASGKVYHARNIRTGQSVALKSMSRQKVMKEGQATQVMREVSIMRRLRHPNIVRLDEVLATKTKVYFVMEFAKRGELFAKIAKGRFSEDLSRRYFQQLITTVRYCHSRGVFHRDLKPENLLLDENWNLKVSDFGLSAVTDQVQSDGMLHTLCGTPAYVAPEVLGKKGYDGAKVDIWTCGVILFVLIAGYLPFNDRNLMVMYRKIYKGQYCFPKWTSPDVRRLLSRLLDTNPETRITLDEILRDPWFKKDYKEIRPPMEDLDELKDHAGGNHQEVNRLNAFDIISFSSGFNLSGLLNEPDISEKFVSAEKPRRIVDIVEEVARSEDLGFVRRKNWGAKVEGRNGNFVMDMEIHRLTDDLVVIEVKHREANAAPGDGIWTNKLRPQLESLFYQPEIAGLQ